MFTEIMDLRFASHTQDVQTQYENGTKHLFIKAKNIYTLYETPRRYNSYIYFYSHVARN
jgi:hypothetical protein